PLPAPFEPIGLHAVPSKLATPSAAGFPSAFWNEPVTTSCELVAAIAYVGGNFTSAGGDPLASYVARYTPQAAPSNLFTIGAAKGDLSRGTVRLTVNAPGAGTLTLSGAGVRGAKATTPASPAGVQLTVQATGKSSQTLNRVGRVNVKVTIAFTPTGGSARSRSTTVVLKKRR
ncbi:MAG TPA: hypothetical protein VJ375_07300, partial [Gaiellaceae bacterium]|nr:hypothetical protein [Gaiellaceae bacterium]